MLESMEEELQLKTTRLGCGRYLVRDQVAVGEAVVPKYCFADGVLYGALVAWAVGNESVKLSAFTAGIDGRWKIGEE
jgi:hypothetical protein